MAFEFYKSRKGGLGIMTQYELAPSLTLTKGTPMEFDNTGRLVSMAAVADKPQCIISSDASSTANGGETASVLDIGTGDTIWKSHFVPQLNGVVAQTGGSTSTVIVLADQAYSANDWRGGKLYIKELNLEATITASSSASGSGQQLTFTITSAIAPGAGAISGAGGNAAFGNLFPAAGALLPKVPDGLTVYATPLGRAVLAAKFKSDYSTISQAIADKTGGFAQILEVHLEQTTNPWIANVFL